MLRLKYSPKSNPSQFSKHQKQQQHFHSAFVRMFIASKKYQQNLLTSSQDLPASFDKKTFALMVKRFPVLPNQKKKKC